MSEDKIILTKEQAISLIGDGQDIHTFRSGHGILVGADHSRKELLESIERAKLIEIGGEACKRMGHGLVVWTSNTDPLFVQADKVLLESIENSLTIKSDDQA